MKEVKEVTERFIDWDGAEEVIETPTVVVLILLSIDGLGVMATILNAPKEAQ